MCIDQDWPSGKTTISLLFFDQDISNVYDNFIYSISLILKDGCVIICILGALILSSHVISPKSTFRK